MVLICRKRGMLFNKEFFCIENNIRKKTGTIAVYTSASNHYIILLEVQNQKFRANLFGGNAALRKYEILNCSKDERGEATGVAEKMPKNTVDKFYVDAGKRIAKVRLAKNLTRGQVAEKAGISVKFLYEIENGLKGFNAAILYEISKVLDVSCDFILCGNDVVRDRQEEDLNDIISMFNKEDLPKVMTLLNDIANLF